MSVAIPMLKCSVVFLLIGSSQCFQTAPLLSRSSFGVGFCLRPAKFCSFAWDPSPRVQRVQYIPPLRSNLMGGSDDEPSSKDGQERDMPLVFYRSDNGTRNSEFWDDGAEKQIDNQFFQMISTLTPGEMVGQFIKTASPRVQAAVKKTIMNMLGTLRSSPSFDSNVITTQRALASMMFQMEMTVRFLSTS